MVALKPIRISRRVPTTFPKQERRGGIETAVAQLSDQIVGHEAGTPWWH